MALAVEVLREAGFDEDAVASMLDAGVTVDGRPQAIKSAAE